jgi:hypothetical protein
MQHVARLRSALVGLLALALLLSGCASRFIPNTDVEDTQENRAIVAFCEQYRKAVETKDVPALLSLASPQYYEDGGNVDAADDMDYVRLKQYLTAKYQNVGFADASNIRHEIRYRRVTKDKERNTISVDYTYSGSFRMVEPDGSEKWQNAVEENRLELVPEGESYKIISGM